MPNTLKKEHFWKKSHLKSFGWTAVGKTLRSYTTSCKFPRRKAFDQFLHHKRKRTLRVKASARTSFHHYRYILDLSAITSASGSLGFFNWDLAAPVFHCHDDSSEHRYSNSPAGWNFTNVNTNSSILILFFFFWPTNVFSIFHITN